MFAGNCARAPRLTAVWSRAGRLGGGGGGVKDKMLVYIRAKSPIRPELSLA